jgi:small neutral amino acid transporter SnatA (MarC family)
MSLVDDMRSKWGEMDEIDRKNFFIAVGFIILVIVVVYYVMNAANTLSNTLGKPALDLVNSTIEDTGKLLGD